MRRDRPTTFNEREIRQNIMTEDRETANPGPSSSEDSPNESTPGPAGDRPSLEDDPHPFDRPSGGAQFQGPPTGHGSEGSAPKGGPEAPFAAGSRAGGSGGSDFGRAGYGDSDVGGSSYSDAGFGASGGGAKSALGAGSISSLQDIIDLARMGGGLPAEIAKSWIRKNQTTAMIGAFAVGVFIGAITRD